MQPNYGSKLRTAKAVEREREREKKKKGQPRQFKREREREEKKKKKKKKRGLHEKGLTPSARRGRDGWAVRRVESAGFVCQRGVVFTAI